MLTFKVARRTGTTDRAYKFEFKFIDGHSAKCITQLWIPKKLCLFDGTTLKVRTFWVEKMEDELVENGWKAPVKIEVEES